MKKMTTVYTRMYEQRGNRRVLVGITDNISSGCEWITDVTNAKATIKRDGKALLFKDGIWFSRYDAKAGRTPPDTFIPAQESPDPETGHWPGWVPLVENEKHIWEAISNYDSEFISGQTYEVCGPKIGTRFGANPERLETHILFKHGAEEVMIPDRSLEGIWSVIKDMAIEGIVFHHVDGRMAKIKKADYCRA